MEIVELTGDEADSIALLQTGEIDGYVAIDAYGLGNGVLPVCKVGASDFFFAVSKARPELLRELDAAMIRIQDENVHYNQLLQEKYMRYSGSSIYFSENELNWLSAHGPIRVGYLDNFLAFCGQDRATGALTGALQTFLTLAARGMQNAEVEFEATPFATTAEALRALKDGEIDRVFPVSFTVSDAEDRDVLITSPQMPSEMRAVVRSAALGDFSLEGKVTVALSEDDPGTDVFIMDHFPDWQRVAFKDDEACLKAVTEGKADCFLISNYRVNGISGTMDRYKLSSITTGAEISFAFAINRQDSVLYAILNKLTNLVPTAAVNAALAAWSYGGQKLTFAQFIRQNMLSVLALAAVDMFSDHPAGYYDAILMDVRMPVMNGLEAARAIRELSRPDAKEIPIIAMTANAFDEDVHLSLQAGMNAHLSKPVEPERLYETLEQMIRRG